MDEDSIATGSDVKHIHSPDCYGMDYPQERDVRDSDLASSSDMPLEMATVSNWLRSVEVIEGDGYTFSPMDGVKTMGVFHFWAVQS